MSASALALAGAGASEVSLPMLDVTEAFLAELERIFYKNLGALDMVGGNLLIHVFGVATRTIVTSGPRRGVYREATDDPIDFVLALEQRVLLEMLDPVPEEPLDLEEAAAEEALVMDGDPGVYGRFMSLGRNARNLLSLRCG